MGLEEMSYGAWYFANSLCLTQPVFHPMQKAYNLPERDSDTSVNHDPGSLKKIRHETGPMARDRVTGFLRL